MTHVERCAEFIQREAPVVGIRLRPEPRELLGGIGSAGNSLVPKLRLGLALVPEAPASPATGLG
jgi:hypothetical protein